MLHDLTIFQKTYDFLLWIKQVVAKFAKAHKYSLGLQLEAETLRLLQCIVRANMAREKKAHIEHCLVLYETVCVLVRLSKDFKLITIKQYEFASEKLIEIGRMLGGWLKRFGGGGRFKGASLLCSVQGVHLNLSLACAGGRKGMSL